MSPRRTAMILRTVGVIVTLAFGILLAPLAADAQSVKLARIGLVLPGSAPAPGVPSPLIDAFRRGLRELGHAEGQDVALEFRYAAGGKHKYSDLAGELVRLKVDVIPLTISKEELQCSHTIRSFLGV